MWLFAIVFSGGTLFFYAFNDNQQKKMVLSFVDSEFSSTFSYSGIRVFAIILATYSIFVIVDYLKLVGILNTPLFYVLSSLGGYKTSVIGVLRQKATKFGYYGDYRTIFNLHLPLAFFIFYSLSKIANDTFSRYAWQDG